MHEITGKATPKMMADYNQAMTTRNILEWQRPENVWIKMQDNLRENRRANKLTFGSGAVRPIGNLNFGNKLQHVSLRFPPGWESMSRYQFKCKMKEIFLKF